MWNGTRHEKFPLSTFLLSALAFPALPTRHECHKSDWRSNFYVASANFIGQLIVESEATNSNVIHHVDSMNLNN